MPIWHSLSFELHRSDEFESPGLQFLIYPMISPSLVNPWIYMLKIFAHKRCNVMVLETVYR